MPTPQLLDPHKFDSTDKTPSTGTDAELRAVVVDMLKQGHSDDEVRKFIQKVDDLKSPRAARMAGAMAGIGPGLLTGLIGVPMMVKDAVLDGISMLQGRDPENAKAFVDSVKTFLPKLQEAGPREQAQMISELATSFGTGAAMGGGAFAARKPIAQGVGTGLMKAVEHPAGVRLTSGSAMLGGIYSGNPSMVAAGAAGTLLPDVAEGTGRALYKYGAGKEYVSPAQAKTLSKLEDKFKDAMSTRNGTFADEQTVAAAKEGLEPGVPSVRTSISAKDPNGGRTSVSQAFKTPGETKVSTAESNPMIMGRRLNDYPPDVQAKYRSMGIGGGVQTAGPAGTVVDAASPAGRPAIHLTGSPTASAVMDPEVQARLTDAAPIERRVRAGRAPEGKERRLAPTADDLPATGSIAERAAALRKENPAVDQDAAAMRATAASRVPDNYMTTSDVVNIGEHAADMGDKTLNTLRGAGVDVPEGGMQSTHDIDRAVATLPTPKNLQMGSEATPKEIAHEVRMTTQGGVRLSGKSRAGETVVPTKARFGVPDASDLTDEQQLWLDHLLKTNPDMDPTAGEAFVRKLGGQSE